MSVRLFILGLLNRGDSYGYDIKDKIGKWGMEYWTEIGWSSIYHALKKMAQEGLIEEKEVSREGNRPPKAVYSILDKGRQEFARLLRENTSENHEDKNPIYISLLYLDQLPKEERIGLLKNRLDKLEAAQEASTAKKKFMEADPDAHGYSIMSMERDLMHREVEIKWMKKLINAIAEEN